MARFDIVSTEEMQWVNDAKPLLLRAKCTRREIQIIAVFVQNAADRAGLKKKILEQRDKASLEGVCDSLNRCVDALMTRVEERGDLGPLK